MPNAGGSKFLSGAFNDQQHASSGNRVCIATLYSKRRIRTCFGRCCFVIDLRFHQSDAALTLIQANRSPSQGSRFEYGGLLMDRGFLAELLP